VVESIWWVVTILTGRVYMVGGDHIDWWGIYGGWRPYLVVGYIWWVETIFTGGVYMVGRDHIDW